MELVGVVVVESKESDFSSSTTEGPCGRMQLSFISGLPLLSFSCRSVKESEKY